jgi:hypothetical protein
MPFIRQNYPADWEAISQRIRFERAGNRCECRGECGGHDEPCVAINGQAHPVTGSKVVLTVMHLDHNTGNNEDSNLMAGCQRCHLTYDAAYHARNAAATRRRRKVEAGQMELL